MCERRRWWWRIGIQLLKWRGIIVVEGRAMIGGRRRFPTRWPLVDWQSIFGHVRSERRHADWTCLAREVEITAIWWRNTMTAARGAI